MCQQCDRNQPVQGTAVNHSEDGEKQTFNSAGDAGVKPVELEVHFVGIEAAVGPAAVEPGEVVVDNHVDVSHQSPSNLQELISMIGQLNNCSYAEYPAELLGAAANVNVIISKLRSAYSAEELEAKLDEQKDALTKLIVIATGMFTVIEKGCGRHEVTDEEVAESLLERTGGVTAELISEKVEDAIANTLNGMGLGPRNPL
jgi:hypothetical protein